MSSNGWLCKGEIEVPADHVEQVTGFRFPAQPYSIFSWFAYSVCDIMSGPICWGEIINEILNDHKSFIADGTDLDQ